MTRKTAGLRLPLVAPRGSSKANGARPAVNGGAARGSANGNGDVNGRSALAKPAARRKATTTGGTRRRRTEQVPLGIGPSGAVTRPLKMSELVARRVVQDIIDGAMQTGDGLPSEAAMLDRYGVSRESLREALRLLEVQGLISIRRGPGGGSVVGTVDPANLGRISTLYYQLAGATYRELLEAWIISETMLAELAASNPDEAARRAAMAPYLHRDGIPDSDDELESFIGSHLDFHAAIARLSCNRVLELVLQTSGQIMSHHLAVESDTRSLAEQIAHDHIELAKAISAGQAAKARRLMESHIRGVAELSEEQLGSDLGTAIEWR